MEKYKCENCGSYNIRMKKNYKFGKKSKATVVRSCKECGSYNVEVASRRRRRRR